MTQQFDSGLGQPAPIRDNSTEQLQKLKEQKSPIKGIELNIQSKKELRVKSNSKIQKKFNKTEVLLSSSGVFGKVDTKESDKNSSAYKISNAMSV